MTTEAGRPPRPEGGGGPPKGIQGDLRGRFRAAQGGEGGKGPGRRRRRPPPRETKQEKKAFTGRAPAGPASGPKLAKPDLFSPAPTGKPEEAAGAAHAEL